jgi:hypothetical protein
MAQAFITQPQGSVYSSNFISSVFWSAVATSGFACDDTERLYEQLTLSGLHGEFDIIISIVTLDCVGRRPDVLAVVGCKVSNRTL